MALEGDGGLEQEQGGEKKQTNDHRKLISDLTRGIIPKSWKVDYKIPRDTTVKY